MIYEEYFVIKIYQGARKYNQIFPKKLKRGVTFYHLTQLKNYFLFKGIYPTSGSKEIKLELIGSGREETFSLIGNGTWEENLSESVGIKYKAAIVILEKK